VVPTPGWPVHIGLRRPPESLFFFNVHIMLVLCKLWRTFLPNFPPPPCFSLSLSSCLLSTRTLPPLPEPLPVSESEPSQVISTRPKPVPCSYQPGSALGVLPSSQAVFFFPARQSIQAFETEIPAPPRSAISLPAGLQPGHEKPWEVSARE